MDNELDNASEMPADLPWQLLEEITNDFSEERKIGSGGYGVVYKGVYKNGEEIAVKKLYHMPGLDDKQFQNELQSLTRLRHQNIVRLVGKSYEEKERFGEYEGKLVCAKMIDRAICLEYLHNGSLEKHLSDESSGFPWRKRYKIIKGICDGLKYLHECGIFHLDLKPANILLDKNMVPKIADFGLSRLFSGTRQSHTTNKFLGTLGYVPPEYIEKGKISDKFDVFSLGVIIIGIMTGPDGYSKQSDMSSQNIVEQVLQNWRKRPQEQWKDEPYFDVFCQQVKICIEIALNCVEADRHKRPSIWGIMCDLYESEKMIEKTYKLTRIVLKLDMSREKVRFKALKLAAETFGVMSVGITGNGMDRLEVVGEQLDAIALMSRLRRKIGHAELVTVGEISEDQPRQYREGPAENLSHEMTAQASKHQVLEITERSVGCDVGNSSVEQLMVHSKVPFQPLVDGSKASPATTAPPSVSAKGPGGTGRKLVHILCSAFLVVFVGTVYVMSRPRPVHLIDYACYKPSLSCRVPFATCMEHTRLTSDDDDKSVHFQMRILERSGLGEETCLPPANHYIPPNPIFSAIDDLVRRTGLKPKDIDILVVNCSLFSPTPSLSAMIINKYKLRSNIGSFNLSGMGCSACLISLDLDLARDMLQVHPNSNALVVSTEVITPNFYRGSRRDMLLPNCLFRMGAVTICIIGSMAIL